MPKTYNVCIIGGGPAGLHAAALLAEKGWDCIVLEEDPKIGEPEACTGILSTSGTKETGLDLEEVTMNTVYGANIYSPLNEKIVVQKKEPVARIINRKQLDKELAKKAMQKGAEIKTSSKMIDIRNQNIFLQCEGRGEMIKSQIIIGADGPLSKTREHIMQKPKKNYFIHAIQANGEGNHDNEKVNVYFSSYAKNFFAWKAPETKKNARIGLGTTLGENTRQAFELFTKEKNLETSFTNFQSALIPVGPPLEKTVEKNILLLGDAAFQTKSTTGGGIITGCTAAKTLTQTIDEHFKYKKPLTNYDKKLEPLKKDLRIHYKMHNYLSSFTEESLDKLFVKLKKAGIEEFLNEHGDMDRPSRFITKLATKPRFWLLAGQGIKYLLS
jgi:digeranylgeranylglycerophospholipid reductase